MISFHLTQVFEQFDKSFKLVNSSKIKTKISVGKLFIFATHRNSFFDNIKKINFLRKKHTISKDCLINDHDGISSAIKMIQKSRNLSLSKNDITAISRICEYLCSCLICTIP